MSDKDIEQEIQAKGKTAPRVTPHHIESVIAGEYFFNASEGVAGANEGVALRNEDPIANNQPNDHHKQLSLLTFCVLVLKNGFTVTGESACASPENFDYDIGCQIARENAVNKIWLLEGYLLKQKLSEGV